jgi:phenylacetate-coenzyme A ligase PaaK-like adenylate-forming protein
MSQPAVASPQLQAAGAIRQFAATLRQTQFMPPERMREYQRSLLERLIRHARAQVPFYRDSGRLDPLFRRDDTIDWERWREIPSLTRKEVQDAGSTLHAERVPPETGRTWTLTTSGSTGEPVSVLHCALSGETAWTAILLRDFERHNIDTAQRFARIGRFPQEEAFPGLRRSNAWSGELARIGIDAPRLDIPETMTPEEIIDAVTGFKPAYLGLNPVMIEPLCSWDQDRLLSDLGIDAIFPTGDRLTEQTKHLAIDHFRCRIVNRYSSEECGWIASICPNCDRFHVHSEVIHLEVLDVCGAPVSPGKTGWVVVTPLYNYAMPLIRYDHADQALVGTPDRCQIALTALDAIDGKQPTLFLFPGGLTVRPVIPPATVINLLGAQAFQVAQVADDRCEFRIVPGRLLPTEMRFDEMTDVIRKRWWQGLQVDYRIVERLLGPSPRSKIKVYVREYPGSPATPIPTVTPGKGPRDA